MQSGDHLLLKMLLNTTLAHQFTSGLQAFDDITGLGFNGVCRALDLAKIYALCDTYGTQELYEHCLIRSSRSE